MKFALRFYTFCQQLFWKLEWLARSWLLHLAADVDASIKGSRKQAIYQQNAGVGSFLNPFLHSQSQPSHSCAGDAFSKLNQCSNMRSKLACVGWKLKTRTSGTIKTNTKTAHNRVRQKLRVRFLNHKTRLQQNLRTIQSGVFTTTHMVNEPESANILARSNLIDLTWSNFIAKKSTSLQQIHLQISITRTGATITPSVMFVHAFANSHALT